MRSFRSSARGTHSDAGTAIGAAVNEGLAVSSSNSSGYGFRRSTIDPTFASEGGVLKRVARIKQAPITCAFCEAGGLRRPARITFVTDHSELKAKEPEAPKAKTKTRSRGVVQPSEQAVPTTTAPRVKGRAQTVQVAKGVGIGRRRVYDLARTNYAKTVQAISDATSAPRKIIHSVARRVSAPTTGGGRVFLYEHNGAWVGACTNHMQMADEIKAETAALHRTLDPTLTASDSLPPVTQELLDKRDLRRGQILDRDYTLAASVGGAKRVLQRARGLATSVIDPQKDFDELLKSRSTMPSSQLDALSLEQGRMNQRHPEEFASLMKSYGLHNYGPVDEMFKEGPTREQHASSYFNKAIIQKRMDHAFLRTVVKLASDLKPDVDSGSTGFSGSINQVLDHPTLLPSALKEVNPNLARSVVQLGSHTNYLRDVMDRNGLLGQVRSTGNWPSRESLASVLREGARFNKEFPQEYRDLRDRQQSEQRDLDQRQLQQQKTELGVTSQEVATQKLTDQQILDQAKSTRGTPKRRSSKSRRFFRSDLS